jgi:hypothetical protein
LTLIACKYKLAPMILVTLKIIQLRLTIPVSFFKS